MTVVEFTVPGVPVAQPRQRQAVIAGHVANYTPKGAPVHVYKATIVLAAREALAGGSPLAGALGIAVQFIFPRPQQLLAKRTPAGELPHMKKPDADNCLKAVMDALTGVAWADDRAVYTIRADKFYAAKGSLSETRIRIWQVGLTTEQEAATQHVHADAGAADAAQA